MPTITAFIDANILYSSDLRNLLMRLALTGLFHAKWSAEVHEEWITALLRNRPDLSREKLERTRSLMARHAVDAVVTGYEYLLDTISLPDPNDRHVLAAAIHGRANVIITANLSDFPVDALYAYGIEAQHPDKFITSLFDIAPYAVLKAAREHRISLRNPAKSIETYIATLETQGLRRTAFVLRKYTELL